MAKLIFTGEKFGGRVYEVVAQRTTVGRGATNTLSIHDSSISEQHCEIYDNGSDLIIRDLGSRNGTVVNGKLLRNAQAPLAHGQIVQFGAVAARLELPPARSTSDTVTDITAVHFHAHQGGAKPPSGNPAAVLAAGTPASPTEDHTLIVPRSNATPSDPPPPQTAAAAPNRIWLYGMGALGLVALLWFLLR